MARGGRTMARTSDLQPSQPSLDPLQKSIGFGRSAADQNASELPELARHIWSKKVVRTLRCRARRLAAAGGGSIEKRGRGAGRESLATASGVPNSRKGQPHEHLDLARTPPPDSRPVDR